MLGKTAMEKMSYWVPTLTKYGGCAGLGLLYITDWKLFLQYMPIYNTKFKD